MYILKKGATNGQPQFKEPLVFLTRRQENLRLEAASVKTLPRHFWAAEVVNV
jgi:hypothetical protein